MSTVLIVDNEKNILKTLSMSLKRNSFHVKQAQSGPDALKIIQEESCDYVISDIRMSPMDGFTLSKQIYHDYPWIEIILMSAYAFEDNVDQVNDCFPYYKIKKPFDIDELIQLLKDREKKHEQQKRIVYWGDDAFSKSICPYLKKAGYNIIDLTMVKNDFNSKQEKCDLYLIDSSILNSDEWKLLNQIDLHSPNIPIIILAESNWKNKKIGDQGSNIIILDRHEFLSDPSVGMKRLQSYI